jgi:hypothetical protein
MLANVASSQHLATLREKLVAAFSVEELTTLCADLGLEYAGLPGDSKDAKARDVT